MKRTLGEFAETLMIMAMGVALLWVFVILGTNVPQDPSPSNHYCDMVEIHQQSDGEYGWPDFKQIAKHCQ